MCQIAFSIQKCEGEPHTSETALRTCVYACLLVCFLVAIYPINDRIYAYSNTLQRSPPSTQHRWARAETVVEVASGRAMHTRKSQTPEHHDCWLEKWLQFVGIWYLAVSGVDLSIYASTIKFGLLCSCDSRQWQTLLCAMTNYSKSAVCCLLKLAPWWWIIWLVYTKCTRMHCLYGNLLVWNLL